MADYHAAMGDLAFSRALESLWRLLAETNQYIVSHEPWKLIKTEGPTAKLARILWIGLEAVRIVATGLLPFMPKVAPQVLAAIGVATPPDSLDALRWGGTPTERRAVRAGAPLPAHRQGGLPRRSPGGPKPGETEDHGDPRRRSRSRRSHGSRCS